MILLFLNARQPKKKKKKNSRKSRSLEPIQPHKQEGILLYARLSMYVHRTTRFMSASANRAKMHKRSDKKRERCPLWVYDTLWLNLNARYPPPPPPPKTANVRRRSLLSKVSLAFSVVLTRAMLDPTDSTGCIPHQSSGMAAPHAPMCRATQAPCSILRYSIYATMFSHVHECMESHQSLMSGL